MDKLDNKYASIKDNELDEIYEDMLADFNISMEQAGIYD